MITLRIKTGQFFKTIKRVVLRTLGASAMFVAFIVCAFSAMRIAIHGREVAVPNLANLSDADAAAAAKKLGLNLSVENRFYAGTVPVNHVLSQSPVPGSRVRRGWQIRVTESLGTQQVPVPDLTGQDEHPATLMLKRLQLDLGTVAHIPGPGPAGTILAQSPPPNVSGLDGPHVAILVADDENAPASDAYVMPSIVGLTLSTARSRLSTVGLHIALPTAEPPTTTEVFSATGTPQTPTQDPAIPATTTAAPVYSPTSLITSQSPQPGHRVSRADSIHVTLSSD